MKVIRKDHFFYNSAIMWVLIIVTLLSSCGAEEKVNSETYIKSIEHWQDLRIDSLKGKTGYLNLAGLFWLEDGDNLIGSDSLNKFIFPAKAPPFLGNHLLRNDSVFFIPVVAGQVRVSGEEPADTLLVYSEDMEGKSMNYEDLAWFIIKRGDTFGIRLKDYNHPLLTSFKGIENYPIDEKWRVKAVYEKLDTPKIVMIKNQVGMDLASPVPGIFHFKIDGKEYQLEPVGSDEDATLFLMIYDNTSGDTTYGSGRYIDTPRPDENGIAYIDFNMAYNPPCAFTDFATCTFPHAANRLPLLIEAGEKYTASH